MAKNASLHNAAITKADEFYTQLPDIEAEMRHYKDHFRGKVILCNCDDPYESNFFKYFAMNFNFLGLKKLIATSYSDSPVAGQQLSLFDVNGLNVKKT
ncbi:MAG TPA: adenine-specific methyltransferase EcoRI family protein, partial [Levilinea sp.]|nr:adenine-specific methyltransferase EcoRI family protein [Levilinea sp.]